MVENNNLNEAVETQNTETIETQPADVTAVEEVSVGEKPKKEKTKKSGNGVVIGLLAGVMIMLVALIVMLGIVISKDNKSNKRMDELASALDAVQATTNEYQETLSEMNEQIVDISDFTSRFSAMMGEEEFGASSENDVLIGGEYMIVSTEEISDAYKSGDYSGLDENQKKTMELAAAVIDEVIEEGMTDYEKELAIYDWMYENIKHDDGITVAIPTTGEYADNPLGVLTVKKAVCVGFATTFRLFMQMLDIECMVVHDTYLSHSWDLVKIEGNWYHTDLYMDAEAVRYANFNMTDEMCLEGHDWDMNFFPNATSVEYCYAVVNAEDFTSLEDVAAELRELVEQTESGGLNYKLTGDDKFTQYQQLEIMMEEVDYYVMNSEISDYGWLYWSGFMVDDETFVFTIQFEYWDYEDDYEEEEYPSFEEITDDEMQDAYDAVEDAFGDFYDEHESHEDYYEEDYYEDDYYDDGYFDDFWEW